MAEASNFDKATLAWTLQWDPDWITAVTFIGATRRLAAANNLGQILLWDLPAKITDPVPLPVRRLDGHTNVISRLLSTHDGKSLISASYDHTIRYWDMQAPATGSDKVILNATTRADLIRRSSSKVPAEVSAKVETQSSAQTLQGHREWVLGLGMSADARVLVSGDDAGQVVVWDRPAGKEVRRWQVKGWVYALALAADAQQLLVSERIPLVFDSGRHAGVKLWNPSKGELRLDLSTTFKDQHISAAAFSPDGKLLALGRGGEVDGQNGKVTFVDPATGKKLRELTPGHEYGVTDLAFHPDGKHLASSGRDTMVRIWQAADGKLVKELGKPRGGQFKDWIHAVAFSADGRWLAAADMAGQVQVWALAGAGEPK
jgi:WD40 repeat protein